MTIRETEELSLFRLIQSMTSLRTSRYEVASQYDLQDHVDRLVATMSAVNKTLPFSFLPDHDAIEVYNQFKPTNFTGVLRSLATSATSEAYERLLVKVISNFSYAIQHSGKELHWSAEVEVVDANISNRKLRCVIRSSE